MPMLSDLDLHEARGLARRTFQQSRVSISTIDVEGLDCLQQYAETVLQDVDVPVQIGKFEVLSAPGLLQVDVRDTVLHKNPSALSDLVKNIDNRLLIVESVDNQQVLKTSISSDVLSKRHAAAPKIKHRARGLPPSPSKMLPPASWALATSALMIYTNSARPMPTKNRLGNPRGNAKNAYNIKGARTSPTSSELTSDSSVWTQAETSLHSSSVRWAVESLACNACMITPSACITSYCKHEQHLNQACSNY